MEKAPLLLAFCWLLLGCTAPGSNIDMHDCGTDLNCFMEYAQNCTGAKVLATFEANELRMEVRGGTVNACRIYFKPVKIEVPEGADVPEEVKPLLGAVTLTDMTCTLDTSDLQNLEPDEKLLESCEGTLKSVLDVVISQQ